MKGGKRRPSVDPPPPPPPPPPAGDGGENHSGGDPPSSHPSNPPLINGPPGEDLSQHLPQPQRRKKRTPTVEKEKIAEEGTPATEEEVEGDENDERDEEGEEGNGHSEEQQMDEGEEEEGDDDRPKLADGYYEIEAVRRKRVRKGQAQYLIKWRGWPETANTWEPLENLLQCSDVIDAFEESMRSGKRSTRKRKRNSATTPSQTKKKKQQQQHSPAADSYSVPAVKIQIESNSLPTPVDDRTISNGEPHVTAVNDTETANTENEKGVELGANRAEETEVANELSLKISELKEAKVTNGDFVDKISLLPKESQFLDQDGLANGSQKSDCSEAIQSSRTGAKKRKSGSVKRFKLDIASDRTNGSQNVVALKGSSGLVADQGVQNADTGINDLQLKNKTENSKTICDITEIIRPVSFTSAMVNNVKDVSVTFTAKRADGKEVAVDNKFLKANHPLLLINYYEQHLKYTPQ
ncbi:OLC1v1001761C3 [Oldenlandia corymbosa var. corymbosa]|uniref:OLC1v1001761C3 n=1 Tax=Oldenlandia corymbosa var. corymbosa TaxID=529605 RepID=A0AAV1D9G9_OLDCO|nr:OLC1v1001761C3 [Oldenlandia corymbosa var. corymbosa]